MAGERGIFLNGSNSIEINSTNISIGSTGNLGVTGSFYVNNRRIDAGVPSGGTEANILYKVDGTDYNLEWDALASPTANTELYPAYYDTISKRIYYFYSPFVPKIFNAAVADLGYFQDGNLLLVGSFTEYSTSTGSDPGNANYLTCLDPAGDISLNPFDYGTGFNYSQYKCIVDSQNRAIIATGYAGSGASQTTSYDGSAVKSFYRILENGALDTSFNTGTGLTNTADARITSINETIDGGYVLTGVLLTGYNGSTVRRMFKINSDGSLDNVFNANIIALNTSTYFTTNTAALPLPDGKILVWPNHPTSTFGGIRLLRFNADGSLDTTFNTTIGNGPSVNVGNGVIVQPGRTSSEYQIIITVQGSSATYIGATVNSVFRINSDGTLDTSFTGVSLSGGNCQSIMLDQTKDKMIIGGTFTTVSGVSRNRVAMIDANTGLLDLDFNPGSGFNNIVTRVIKTPGSSRVVCGGSFTTFDGASNPYLVRLNYKGQLE